MHLKLRDSGNWDEADNKVAQHVDHGRRDEKFGLVEAFPLATGVLLPKVGQRLTASGHGHPHIDRIGDSQEPAEYRGPFQVRLHRRKDSVVEAQN